MPNVLVWGRTRDLIAGDLPTGMPVAEVSSLDEARAQSDSRGTLLLTDPGVIAAHAEGFKGWLRGGEAVGTLLVAVTEPQAGDDILRRFPFVDDLLVKPVTPGRLRLRLHHAFDSLHNRRVVRQLEEKLERKSKDLREINQIGVALSAERDIDKLLDLILKKSREITAADAGSLYLVERGKDDSTTQDDQLRFKLTQNDSVVVSFEEFTMPLSAESIAGYAALIGETVNVRDVYRLPPGMPYSGSGGAARSFDEKSGYRTRSMLAVPMRDHKGQVIGVVQLINKKRNPGAVLRPVGVVEEEVTDFNAVDEQLVRSLASQAAVAYENTLLIQNIRNLFDKFVEASVITIEKRDPTTKGHSRRVEKLTVGLAEKVDAIASGRFRDVTFNREQLKQIGYAALLHDFGKVGVKERYLLKADKLYKRQMQLVEQRFDYILRTEEVEHLRAKIRRIEAGASREALERTDQDFEARRGEIARLREMLREANKPLIVEDGGRVRAAVDQLAKRRYVDLEGVEQPFLTSDEVESLSLERGSLTLKEREEINKHVQNTYDFLKTLPWTSELKRVPEIAGKHHEKLDGSGYPSRLKAPDIPIETRMMTISDIYDALTAWDRPYKKAVPVEKALDILRDEEAGRGKIDKDLLDVFIEAKVYEITRAELEARTVGRAPASAAEVVERMVAKGGPEAVEHALLPRAGAKVVP
jgi:HD-GYP domain-containing protein (c-di-GMP phosphodiesterase class II)